jgi:hypothetical protein
MRTLYASEIAVRNTRTVSLYRHVANRDELIQLAVDDVFGELDPPGLRHPTGHGARRSPAPPPTCGRITTVSGATLRNNSHNSSGTSRSA